MLRTLGADWIEQEVQGLTDTVIRKKPSEYNEETRYLPASVTPLPGYIRYSVNPFMREIVDCFDPDNEVREVTLKKGVQITYTTVLESGLLYAIGHQKTLPVMFMTADKELAKARIENNIIPMLQQSDLWGRIRSSDAGNSRKTGATADHLQWEGGGYLVPFGAKNAAKMRSFSIAILLKDEIDGWPDTVGKDGDPDSLSDDRCSAYWERRKIFRGSTPLLVPSRVDTQFKRGDQRVYKVRCKKCNFPQVLRWEAVNKENGIVGGFQWELDDGSLVLESVRYCCVACGEPHFEHDKERLFSEDEGAAWTPTARPVEPGIRSYHLPAMYSPVGLQPWYKCVTQYLDGYDPVERKVRDIKKYQVFYNNILAEPFEVRGTKIQFSQVSHHRRAEYRLGEIPNKYAEQHSGSKILFLTCLVDVHKSNLAVSVIGFCRGSRPYVIDYWRIEPTEKDGDCGEITSSVWARLREIIEESEYTADDGTRYRIPLTLVDAGYANATVCDFCAEYAGGVYPILGRDRPGKNQTIREFSEFTTQAGTTGFKIVVDHYKDRTAMVLRREWYDEDGPQKEHHFNAPVDMTDKQLKELTTETRREKFDATTGVTSYFWYRPGNARNELWDLLNYGYAGTEILAWQVCVQHFEQESIDWPRFWDYIEAEALYFEAPEA